MLSGNMQINKKIRTSWNKGKSSWNKGGVCTYREKISKAMKGKHTSPNTQFKKGHKYSVKHGLYMFNPKLYKHMYYLKNIEKWKKYQEDNKEKIKENHRMWIKNHPLWVKARNHDRKIKKRGLTIKIIQQVYEDNIKKYGTLTCYLCEEPIKFGKDHLEHKTPISRGGNNDFQNLCISCNMCNQHKYNKTEQEYRESLKCVAS